MESADLERLERKHYGLIGAVEAISTLREELELRSGQNVKSNPMLRQVFEFL